jgi:hypothetical protein
LAVQFFRDGADARYARALDILNDPLMDGPAVLQPRQSRKLARGSEDKEHAISQQSNCAIAVIGIVSSHERLLIQINTQAAAGELLMCSHGRRAYRTFRPKCLMLARQSSGCSPAQLCKDLDQATS